MLIGLTNAANILVLSPYTTYSHTNFFIPVVKELARRGHSVTYWNGLKPREEIDNVVQLYSQQLHDFNSNHHRNISFDQNNPFALLMSLRARLRLSCNVSYSDPVFDKLLKMKNATKFDVVLIEGFMNDCMLPLAAFYQAPFIYMTSVMCMPWIAHAADTPLSMDHFPITATAYTDEMNLWQRIGNTLTGVASLFYRYWFVLPVVDEFAARVWADPALPSVREIETNLSLWITNSQIGISYQFPKTAVVVEAGGLHFEPSKSLSKVSDIFRLFFYFSNETKVSKAMNVSLGFVRLH